MKKISDELKKAIERMPEKEKNKLLLRLVQKDAMLVQQLEFKLLGSESVKDSKKEELLSRIERRRFVDDTPGWLMMNMRELSGDITRYYKVTKDKEGEIELLLALLITGIEKSMPMLKAKQHRAAKFADYVVKKTLLVLGKLSKLHEDYHTEYRKDVDKILRIIYHYEPTKLSAEEMALPKAFEV